MSFRRYILLSPVLGPAVQYNGKVVGTISLRKVVFPLGGDNYRVDPYYNITEGYLSGYQSGRKPSLSAVLQWLNYFLSTYTNGTLQPSDWNAFWELRSYVANDIGHRRDVIWGPPKYNV